MRFPDSHQLMMKHIGECNVNTLAFVDLELRGLIEILKYIWWAAFKAIGIVEPRP